MDQLDSVGNPGPETRRREGWHRIAHSLWRWAHHVGLGRKLAFALTWAALISGVATYVLLTEGLEKQSNPNLVISLLYFDIVILLLLTIVVARRVVSVWLARRSGVAGSRLHSRLVLLFGVVAATPAILVTVFSVAFFHFGVQAWFSDRVSTAINESLAVARAYLEEHTLVLAGDAEAMAKDINVNAELLIRSPQLFNKMVAEQAGFRALTEAIVFDHGGRVLARSPFALSIELAIDQIPASAYEKAAGGEVAILTTPEDDRVRALVRLDALPGAYLFVGRFVDPKVIGHMERTSAAAEEYKQLQGRRSNIEISFAFIFGLVALLLLIAGVWVGLTLATSLVRPISNLIHATERVRSGDLGVRVSEEDAGDELGLLSKAFNRMTDQLAAQQAELMAANRQLDERRRFTETVLAGVSAGVIGLDAHGNVNLPNRSASELLGIDLEDKIGLPLAMVVPEMAECFEAIRQRPDRFAQVEIRLGRETAARILLVRMAAEQMEGEVMGYVVTFDDITELVSAQRKAAWADVARRIAHEIKNPLTPIQLSAERLKRKYLKHIQTDAETFVACTDTIIRQVGDIGRMVDEFSSFARMPAPVFREHDLREVVRQAVFLQAHGNADIAYDSQLPDDPVILACDDRLVGQALTNVLKNAAESIHGRDRPSPPGVIAVRLERTAEEVTVEVDDNGRGLPREIRDRLTEPYVTTRAKGTGLGLAIVKKIMEDHGGDLTLDDRADGGARVRLIFPLRLTAATNAAEANHGS